jgi:hypothetical protein
MAAQINDDLDDGVNPGHFCVDSVARHDDVECKPHSMR